MRVALVGLGTTGSHIARQLTQTDATELSLHDSDEQRLVRVASAVRSVASGLSVSTAAPDPADPPDVVVLASPAGTQTKMAASMVAAGSHVVSISDDPEEVRQLLALDVSAKAGDRSVAVGAGFVPGLSCLLTRYAADQLDTVDVINIYKAGTGGPECARQHHRALQSTGYEWRDGDWVPHRGGSGRDLAWFPEPFGARDCYRAALPSPELLQATFPEAGRISARMSATRRDRMTSRLPMLRPPHDDGGPGALRVEVRGRSGQAVETLVLGSMDHPSVAAATLSALTAVAAANGELPVGAGGLASWPDPKPMLNALRDRGIRVAAYGGLLEPLS